MIILVLFALITGAIVATPGSATVGPDATFARTYSGPDFLAASARQTKDGGFIVAGLAANACVTAPCPQCTALPCLSIILLRLDGNGAVVWQKVYAAGSAGCTVVAALCIPGPEALQTPDGGFVVEGTVANVCGVGIATSAALVFKVDTTGSLVWQKALCGDGIATASSIDLTSDGGIVLAGSTNTAVRSQGDLAGTALVLKLDSAGSLIWQRTYAGALSVCTTQFPPPPNSIYLCSPYIGTRATSIRQTSDGGFVVAGETTGGFDAVAWLLKLDSGGNIVWQNSYPGSTLPVPYGFAGYTPFSAQQTSDGGFITFGDRGGLLVLRLDSAGAPIWQKSYGKGGGFSGQQTSDGGFIVAGFNSTSVPEPLVLRLDSMGNIIWQRILNSGPGATAEALSVQQTSDGGFVATGVAVGPEGTEPHNALVFKLNSEGQINSCKDISESSLVPSTTSTSAFSITGGSAVDITSTSPAITTKFTSVDTSATSTVLCLAVSQISASVFFTDSALNRLPLDSMGNPMVNVTLAGSIVRSTNPGQVLAWVNVTNTGGSSLQSLKLDETLPRDWAVNPAWMPGVGAIQVFFANTTSLATNPEITQRKAITVSTGNPETIHLAINNFTATTIGHPLMPGQSILLSVKLTYTLKGSSQSATSYPRDYTDTATAAAWTQVSFSGTKFTGNVSAFFTAVAKVVS